ncbi:MAG TPA: hypothetical protein PLK55_02240, partial [archaeon]|nr:hypothetical protein [archaeon]
SSNFTAEETSSVKIMVDGISSETMCFNFNNGFMLWYNPQKTTFSVDANMATTENATAGTGQGSISPATPTPATGPAQLAITGGNFNVNTPIGSEPAKVTGGNLTLDLENKKLSGTVKFESGNKTAEVSISSGKAIISGNTVQLNISGKALGFDVTASGNLNISGNQGIDGTYTIVSGQKASLTGPVLTLSNLNFTKTA